MATSEHTIPSDLRKESGFSNSDSVRNGSQSLSHVHHSDIRSSIQNFRQSSDQSKHAKFGNGYEQNGQQNNFFGGCQSYLEPTTPIYHINQENINYEGGGNLDDHPNANAFCSPNPYLGISQNMNFQPLSTASNQNATMSLNKNLPKPIHLVEPGTPLYSQSHQLPTKPNFDSGSLNHFSNDQQQNSDAAFQLLPIQSESKGRVRQANQMPLDLIMQHGQQEALLHEKIQVNHRITIKQGKSLVNHIQIENEFVNSFDNDDESDEKIDQSSGSQGELTKQILFSCQYKNKQKKKVTKNKLCNSEVFVDFKHTTDKQFIDKEQNHPYESFPYNKNKAYLPLPNTENIVSQMAISKSTKFQNTDIKLPKVENEGQKAKQKLMPQLSPMLNRLPYLKESQQDQKSGEQDKGRKSKSFQQVMQIAQNIDLDNIELEYRDDQEMIENGRKQSNNHGNQYNIPFSPYHSMHPYVPMSPSDFPYQNNYNYDGEISSRKSNGFTLQQASPHFNNIFLTNNNSTSSNKVKRNKSNQSNNGGGDNSRHTSMDNHQQRSSHNHQQPNFMMNYHHQFDGDANAYYRRSNGSSGSQNQYNFCNMCHNEYLRRLNEDEQNKLRELEAIKREKESILKSAIKPTQESSNQTIPFFGPHHSHPPQSMPSSIQLLPQQELLFFTNKVDITNRDFLHKKVGKYSLKERYQKIRKFKEKKQRRIWHKKIFYDCRKQVADKRLRIKGRFIRKEDQKKLLREIFGNGELFPQDVKEFNSTLTQLMSEYHQQKMKRQQIDCYQEFIYEKQDEKGNRHKFFDFKKFSNFIEDDSDPLPPLEGFESFDNPEGGEYDQKKFINAQYEEHNEDYNLRQGFNDQIKSSTNHDETPQQQQLYPKKNTKIYANNYEEEEKQQKRDLKRKCKQKSKEQKTMEQLMNQKTYLNTHFSATKKKK